MVKYLCKIHYVNLKFPVFFVGFIMKYIYMNKFLLTQTNTQIYTISCNKGNINDKVPTIIKTTTTAASSTELATINHILIPAFRGRETSYIFVINPWSPGGPFLVQKMAVCSPVPGL